MATILSAYTLATGLCVLRCNSRYTLVSPSITRFGLEASTFVTGYENSLPSLIDGRNSTGIRATGWVRADFGAPVTLNRLTVEALTGRGDLSTLINTHDVQYSEFTTGPWYHVTRRGVSSSQRIVGADRYGSPTPKRFEPVTAQHFRIRQYSSSYQIAFSEWDWGCDDTFFDIQGTVECTGHLCEVAISADKSDLGTALDVFGTVRGSSVQLDASNVRLFGSVVTDQRGYLSGQGPGSGVEPLPSPERCAGLAEAMTGVGGTHGGIGGDSCARERTCTIFPRAVRTVYGDVQFPRSFGSGGGVGRDFETDATARGGAGGGRVLIKGTNVHMAMQSRVSSNGQNYNELKQYYAGGAGSGGSIVLQGANVTGYGSLYADGGDSYSSSSYASGNGGGGRIALLADEYLSTRFAVVSANGGTTSSCDGGAGSIFRSSASRKVLTYANGNSGSTTGTPLPDPLPDALDLLVVEERANVTVPTDAVLDVDSVWVAPNSYITGTRYTLRADNFTLRGKVQAQQRVTLQESPAESRSISAKAHCPATPDPTLRTYVVLIETCCHVAARMIVLRLTLPRVTGLPRSPTAEARLTRKNSSLGYSRTTIQAPTSTCHLRRTRTSSSTSLLQRRSLDWCCKCTHHTTRRVARRGLSA